MKKRLKGNTMSRRSQGCRFDIGMLKPDFFENRFSVVENRFSVLLTFIKINYYIRQIILCTGLTHCNVHTRKAVSTLICSFSRFSLNEAMNIVYTVCFKF